jgi:hypothetical protein
MSFRFHRSTKLFPGVRLNFSAHGISTTIGVRGASLNLGPCGTYLNLGLPGSGLAYRTRVDRSAPNSQEIVPGRALHPSVSLIMPAETTIHSGPVETMTTPGLEGLKRLINEAADHRIELTTQINADEHKLGRARGRLSRARWVIVRLFTRDAIPKLVAAVSEAEEILKNRRLQLAGCSVEIDFGLDEAASSTYSKLIDSFEVAAGCDGTWQIVTTAQVDRVAARSIAGTRIRRRSVQFARSKSDIIDTQYDSLKFGDVAGSDIHVYPSFALYREPGGDFALVELPIVDLKMSTTRYVEDEGVPSDAQTQGYTWRKANKDGSRDRRFNGNYQIPIAVYGELALVSRSGLNELYMLSNQGKANELYSAFAAHKAALASLGKTPRPQEAPQHDPESLLGDEPDDCGLNSSIPDSADSSENIPRPRYIADWVALAALVGLSLFGGWWIHQNPDRTRNFLARTFNATPKVDQPIVQPVIVEKPAPIVTAKAEPQAVRETMVVRASGANVRSDASTNSVVVATMRKGARLTVFERKGDWVQIGDTKPIGWIHKNLLENGNGAKPTAAASEALRK